MSPIDDSFYVLDQQPTPHWYIFPDVAPFAEKLEIAASFNKNQKEALVESWEDLANIEALIKTALAIKKEVNVETNKETTDSSAAKFAMYGIYETLRENVMLFACWDNALGKLKLDDVVKDLSVKNQQDGLIADKVAWLYSSLIGHLSHHFQANHVNAFIDELDSSTNMSDLGKLEAVTNLLKSTTFRAHVWSKVAARNVVEKVTAKPEDPKLLYKCVFAYWMLSFDDATMAELSQSKAKGTDGAVAKIKDFLSAESKAEKVVRLSLEVLQNFLKCPALAEDIATSQVLPAVKALEYEKWRDGELYDKIRQISQAIDLTVSQVSNFDRYKKELEGAVKGLEDESGKLVWSPLHSSAFWAENHTQKDLTQDIVKDLTKLVQKSKDAKTVAVACNDIGEIAVLHKDGKAWVREAKAKDAVMEKMSEENDKEVRREALLCCQKIMLNKWQEIPQK